MRGKVYAVITVCISCFVFVWVGLLFLKSNSKPMDTEQISKVASIKIDEQHINSSQAKIYPNYGIVPMFSVFEGFNVSTQWLKNGDAVISYGEHFATLSLTRMELIEEQHGHDWFTPLPGCSYYYCEQIGNEIYLDDLTMHNILYQLGIRTEIIVDYPNSQILIKTRDKNSGDRDKGTVLLSPNPQSE